MRFLLWSIGDWRAIALASFAGWGITLPTEVLALPQGCPLPVLQRLQAHRVQPGETLKQIADRYGLLPTTLMGLNPTTRSGQVKPGETLRIPPFNGIEVTGQAAQTWQDLANRYRVRPDVLFETNGCTAKPPSPFFVPGVSWSPLPIVEGTAPDQSSPGNNANRVNPWVDLRGYPLPEVKPLVLRYGWQQMPGRGDIFFHSGVDLLAVAGTPVLAIGEGTVAFAGPQGNYGNLVVINHRGGWQSRYAHLSVIEVKVGDRVSLGQPIGKTGITGHPDWPEAHLHFEVRLNSSLGWVAENPEQYLEQRPR